MFLTPRRIVCLFAMILVLFPPRAQAAVLGWWSFDGIVSNIVDISNNDHHGVIRNVPAQLDDGNQGFSFDVPGTQMTATAFGTWHNPYALHLNGTNGYVEITNNIPTLSLTNDPSSFTLEMFVKLDAVLTNGERLVNTSEANHPGQPAAIDTWFTGFGTPPRPAIGVTDNQAVSGNPQFARDRNPPVISVGKWHHLAFVKDGSNLVQYVDYQVNGSNTWEGMAHTLTNLGRFIIGSTIMAPYNCFDGSIDEVRFSDVALAPADFIRAVGGLPPILRNISSSEGSINALFSSDTSSVYVVESAPPGANSGPWSYEGTVTGAAFYTSHVLPQTNEMRQYRVQRNVP